MEDDIGLVMRTRDEPALCPVENFPSERCREHQRPRRRNGPAWVTLYGAGEAKRRARVAFTAGQDAKAGKRQ